MRLYTHVCTAYHTMANRLGLPCALHALIHWLLIHQSEPKPSMRQSCFDLCTVWTLNCAWEWVSASKLQPWSKWTANSDKKLNVDKPCMTSRKTAFRFLKAFFFSYLDPFLIWFKRLLKLINLGSFNIICRCVITLILCHYWLLFSKYGLDLDPNDGWSLFLKMFPEDVILQKINKNNLSR